MAKYYVYIMSSESSVLYIGVTNDLERRVAEHKSGVIPGFSKKYACRVLAYYEETSDVRAAIAREKEIKKWRREKKERLIRALNPEWRDLSV